MSESTHDADRRDAGPTELAAFQDALARLQPAPEGINTARLLFQAGQRSAMRRSWAWPCLTAASTMLAATLGAVLLLRPTSQPTERIVTVYVQPPSRLVPQADPPIPSTTAAPISPFQPSVSPDTEQPVNGDNYLQLRRAVLARGVDALPPPTPWPAAAPVHDSETLLDIPYDSRSPWFLRLKRSLKSGGAL